MDSIYQEIRGYYGGPEVTPPEYAPQYTIHVYFDGPMCVCQVIYEKMLDEVLNLFPIGVTPVVETIMTDFEKAAINAFEKKFSDAQVAGCYFHLGQCAWRRIQREEANYKRYKEDPAFAIRVRRFLALAFVPPNEVHRYMNLLMADEVARNDGLVEFATYFQKTYVGQQFHNDDEVSEIPGTYNYPIWNMFDRVRQNKPRTNNSLEGWHGAFARGIRLHPSVVDLAKKYRQEQDKRIGDHILHIQARIKGANRTKIKYQHVTKRLKEFTDRLESNVLVDLMYLEQVAIAMKVTTE